MGRAQTKDLKPAVVFTLLGKFHALKRLVMIALASLYPPTIYIAAIWEYQARHGGALPDASSCAPELEAIATELFNAAEINKRVLTSMPKDIVEYVLYSASCR